MEDRPEAAPPSLGPTPPPVAGPIQPPARAPARAAGRRRLLLLAPALLVLAAFALLWLLWVGPGPSTRPTPIVVERGQSVADLGRQLHQAGLIRARPAWFRRMAAWLASPDPIQAGEFLVPPRLSAYGILNLVQHGRPIQRLVTVPEGMPSVLVRDRLMHIPYLTGDIPVPEEGSVLPNSYSYRRGETRAAVLGRMQAAMRTTLARLWAARRPGLPVTTPREAIILASIVEKETAVPSERPTK